ncbi:MAG: hypothetical protein ABJ360_12215 [Roseobacter sp.]
MRDIANLANGGYVVADDEGFNTGRVLVRIFDYADSIETEITSVNGVSSRLDDPRVAAIPSGAVVAMYQSSSGWFFVQVFNVDGSLASIRDPLGEVINLDDYGQLLANILAIDTITTGINGSTVL